jgi:hypothetical protein
MQNSPSILASSNIPPPWASDEAAFGAECAALHYGMGAWNNPCHLVLLLQHQPESWPTESTIPAAPIILAKKDAVFDIEKNMIDLLTSYNFIY